MARRSLAVALLLVVATTVSRGQAPSSVPRDHNHRPDFNGVWDFRTQIPLERPKEMGERAFLTAQEIASRRSRAAEPRVSKPPQPRERPGTDPQFGDPSAPIANN